MVRHVFSVSIILLTSMSGAAHPVVVDLGDERAQFELRDRNRKVGLSLLAVALVAGGAATFGWVGAAQSRSSLLAETQPIDISARQSLVSVGQLENGIGIVSAVVTVIAGVVCGYFLAVSF